MRRFLIWCFVAFVCTQCASEPSDLSDKQRAQIAMNDGRYEEAITILTEYTAIHPEDYEAICLLASAHVARVGISFLSILDNQLMPQEDGAEGEQSDIFTQLEDILPDGADVESLESINTSISLLQALPSTVLLDESSQAGRSANIQLLLYLSLRASLIVVLIKNGSLSPEESLAHILASFAQIANISGDFGSFKESVAATLERIEAMPGETQEQQLSQYLEL